jgi:hypothetical protein
MKRILFLTGVTIVLTTTGCIVSEGGRRGHYQGHEGYRGHSEIIVGPPEIVVRPPEIIVR